ncbi:MAG: 3-keto-5-aminohexanoate cleavage protein [Acidimicrobiia bacterium]|nr:3-keto-5-aminohexanoate cleavage protein [Acidimicrobiia bacterium]
MRDRPWAPPPLGGWPDVIVNVALTGAVPTKDDSPAVPMVPEEIVEDAVACARAGAACVHVHVRDDDGRPTHRRDLYEKVIGAIRDQAPELVVCMTTSARVDPDPRARMTALDLDDELLPDMASCTLGSFNFPRTVSHNPPEVIEALLRRMAERGVRPELEVFELGMANYTHVLQERGLLEPPLYVNVLLGSLGAAPAFVGDLARIVERLPAGSVWSAAGIGVFQRPMVMAAIAMGGNVRTGLEDAPRDLRGEPTSNVAAVEHAVAAARLAGRGIATPAQARERLGLPPRR